MGEQLARNSVKTYRFAPEGFEAVRKRLTLIQNITFVGVLGLIIGMDFKGSDKTGCRVPSYRSYHMYSLLPSLECFSCTRSGEV